MRSHTKNRLDNEMRKNEDSPSQFERSLDQDLLGASQSKMSQSKINDSAIIDDLQSGLNNLGNIESTSKHDGN